MPVASHVWFLLNSSNASRLAFFFFLIKSPRQGDPDPQPRPEVLPPPPAKGRERRGRGAHLGAGPWRRAGGCARVLSGDAAVPPATPDFKRSGRCQRGYAPALSPTSEGLSERSPLGPASPLLAPYWVGTNGAENLAGRQNVPRERILPISLFFRDSLSVSQWNVLTLPCPT